MLHSYEVFKQFELIDIRPDIQGETEPIVMNPFIRIQSFFKQKRKIAVMLRAKDPEDIFRYEKMYFLVYI